jgi:hypothetical protein
LAVQDERIWLHWTEGASIDLAKLYGKGPPLFTLDAVRALQRARKAHLSRDDARAMEHLYIHFLGEYVSEQMGEVSEAQANLEASLQFTVSGNEHAYRDLERLLANEKSAPRRQALYEAATASVTRVFPVLKRREEMLNTQLAELGYPQLAAFAQELRQADFEAVRTMADQILDKTRTAYSELLGMAAQKELGIGADKLRRADIPRLFGAHGNIEFPKQSQWAHVEETLAALGIKLDTLPNLKVDGRPLPRKNPRPLALAIKAPSDVRLSYKPSSGGREEAALFHELGHALHFASTEEKRFELAKLGQRSAVEAFAHLFESLFENSSWLTDVALLSAEQAKVEMAFARARRLYLIRRAAGLFLYSLNSRSMDEKTARAYFRTTMARALLLPMGRAEEERYLVEREDFFNSSDTLRGHALAAIIEYQLKSRYGASWWRHPKSAEFLKRLWAPGRKLRPEELARLAGEERFTADALISDLSRVPHEPKDGAAPVL